MKVQEKIRAMRETKNWSQEEMAEKLNMSVSGYSKIERGETNPHFSKLQQIAEILGIDLIELISFGEKHVYLVNGDGNNALNVIGASNEIAFEIQKLQIQLNHKDEIITEKDKEIALLKRIIDLMGTKNTVDA